MAAQEPAFARPVQRVYRLRSAVDTTALLAAFRYVVSAHPSLRLRLTADGSGQRFPPLEAQIAGVRVRGRTRRLRAAYARAVLAADAERAFDLTREPPFLVRIVEVDGDHYLGVVLDHLAADETAADLLERELDSAYGRELSGEPHPEPRPGDFIEYLELEPARRAVEAHNLEWWVRRLTGAPLRQDGEDATWVRAETFAWHLSGGALSALETACRARRCSLFVALLAAQAEVLGTALGTSDLILNVPVSNRVRPVERTWIANLSMLLHVRLRRGSKTAADGWLTHVRDELLAAMAHRQVDYAQLAGALARDASARGGRVDWSGGSSFLDSRETPSFGAGILAERVDEQTGGRVDVPSGSCAFTARRRADDLRVSVVWDPVRVPLGELLAEDAHLTALARLTGTGSRDQLAGVS